jgi:hypothetical protein
MLNCCNFLLRCSKIKMQNFKKRTADTIVLKNFTYHKMLCAWFNPQMHYVESVVIKPISSSILSL